MRARLARLAHPPRLIAAGWEEAEVTHGHDTVLAATMPAFFDHPEAFLARCRAWARTVVWVVPAHAGPQGFASPAACRPNGMARTRRPASTSRCAAWRPRRSHRTLPSPTGPSPASCPISWSLPLSSPIAWAGPVGRPPRTNDSASRPAGEARDRAFGSTSRENLPFLCGGTMNKRTLAIASLMPFGFASTALAQDQSHSRRHRSRWTSRAGSIFPARGLHHRDRPARAGQPHRRHRADHPAGPHREVDRAVGHRSPGRERRRLHERMDARPDLDQHPRRLDRGPGPRLPQPGADPDQRPSRRHRQRLQAVDRRHRAHRDRARPVVGRLRQPEHGRRDQHHPEDRPDRAGQRSSRPSGLLEPVPGQGADRRLDSGLRLVCRRRGRHARRLHPGGAPEENTAWTRYGGTGAFGYQIDENNRVDVTIRTTASTMRASAARAPTSSPSTPATTTPFDSTTTARRADGQGNVFFQAYCVSDVDDLNNPSPLSALNAVGAAHHATTTGASSTSSARASSRATSPGGNELLLGIDWERSRIRSDRYRLGGAVVTQLSPQDNNQTENVFALLCRGCAELLRRPADRARRRAPDLGHHGARLDAVRADPDPRQQ